MITAFSLLVICIASFYLIDCQKYDDGVFGRVALSMLSLGGAVGFIETAFYEYQYDPVSQVIFAALALFEVRHIYRVYRIYKNPPLTFLKAVIKHDRHRSTR